MTITTTDAIDLAIQRQALAIEMQLHALHQETAPQPVPIRILSQGGLERHQHQPHKLTYVGSNPTPATNRNAGCYDQVHAFPKGRWS